MAIPLVPTEAVRVQEVPAVAVRETLGHAELSTVHLVVRGGGIGRWRVRGLVALGGRGVQEPHRRIELRKLARRCGRVVVRCQAAVSWGWLWGKSTCSPRGP